jgi:hypothetical protein
VEVWNEHIAGWRSQIDSLTGSAEWVPPCKDDFTSAMVLILARTPGMVGSIYPHLFSNSQIRNTYRRVNNLYT